MHKMEQRSASKLRIIFGDHKVTPALMTSLGIQETCLLIGDYYHNMNEVFKVAMMTVWVHLNLNPGIVACAIWVDIVNFNAQASCLIWKSLRKITMASYMLK
jgi:hypothetical protein